MNKYGADLPDDIMEMFREYDLIPKNYTEVCKVYGQGDQALRFMAFWGGVNAARAAQEEKGDA